MKNSNKVIYQIFVRNYSNEGTFQKVESDLERIKELGVDIIYLMPIHEIGVLNRKGTYGSPYAIKDYFSISPDLGTMDDFVSLVNKTHELGMEIIIDMVFNHTAPDNVLVGTHPEYYYYKDGKRGNRVGDWTDIVDLDTTREDTQEYLVSVLAFWCQKGVDGFRFDVASMIPLSFFLKAREALGKDVFFFGECVDSQFGKHLLANGQTYVNDLDIMQAFDCLYNYNWYHDMVHYLQGEAPLSKMIKNIKEDNPKITRVNCLENHDNDRISFRLKNKQDLKEWVRFVYALNGHAFIYMGQEYGISHKPELFEKDPVFWEKDEELFQFYKSMNKQKHQQENGLQDLLIKDDRVSLNGTDYTL